MTEQDLAAELERRRRELAAAADRARAELPLRYWRQQAHFTTPAGNLEIAKKAVELGAGRSIEQLAKLGIGPTDLAAALEVPLAEIEHAAGARAPLVMLDNEDAQVADAAVVARGRSNAVALLREADWGASLRFFRPSGLALDWSVPDLIEVLAGAGTRLDGIVWPKVQHAAELAWVCESLSALERRHGIAEGSIKLAFLVESGWALLELAEIIRAAQPRLCAIIYGSADHAADVGLPKLTNAHPLADLSRALIVNAAGAAGVPAIDSMTWLYPVADRSASPEQNRRRVLERLRLCFDEARHAFDLGMQGKWVGHPLQLLVTLAAFRSALPQSEVDAEVRALEAYRASAAEQKGTTIIGGAMSDRATDRHVRARLRRAVVLGRLAPARAVELGVIAAEEARSL